MAADRSQPHNALIAIYGVVTVVFLFLVTFGLLVFYSLSVQKFEAERGRQPNDMIEALRAEENEKLNRYRISPDTGKIQIRIDRAIALEAEKPWRPNTPRPSPTPTPAPTPAATPALNAQQEVTTHALSTTP